MKRGMSDDYNSPRRGQIRGKEFLSEKGIVAGLEDINHLIKVLGKHIELLDAAHKRRDHREFNILKKQVLEIQRRIHSLID